MIATPDLADDNASAPDAGWLFGPPPAPEVPAVVCRWLQPDPKGFGHVQHADEVASTRAVDGIVRMTWTCRACGNVRGRVS